MNDIPYFAIGNNELEVLPVAKDKAKCPMCKKLKTIKYGTDTKTGEVSKMLGFVNCGKEAYMVSINGKLLN